ncbi:unnamed protein product [Arabidopsis lyrata]|nr:unnamed protein product [Arabidopsis lyrata]
MGSRLFSSNGGQIQSPPPFAQRRRRRRPQKPFRSLWRLLLLSNPFSDPPNPVLLLFLRSSVVYLLPPFRSISVPKLGKTFGGGRSSARDTIGRVAPELWQENFEAICRN